jgi:hypothetical protein
MVFISLMRPLFLCVWCVCVFILSLSLYSPHSDHQKSIPFVLCIHILTLTLYLSFYFFYLSLYLSLSPLCTIFPHPQLRVSVADESEAFQTLLHKCVMHAVAAIGARLQQRHWALMTRTDWATFDAVRREEDEKKAREVEGKSES